MNIREDEEKILCVHMAAERVAMMGLKRKKVRNVYIDNVVGVVAGILMQILRIF